MTFAIETQWLQLRRREGRLSGSLRPKSKRLIVSMLSRCSFTSHSQRCITRLPTRMAANPEIPKEKSDGCSLSRMRGRDFIRNGAVRRLPLPQSSQVCRAHPMLKNLAPDPIFISHIGAYRLCGSRSSDWSLTLPLAPHREMKERSEFIWKGALTTCCASQCLVPSTRSRRIPFGDISSQRKANFAGIRPECCRVGGLPLRYLSHE